MAITAADVKKLRELTGAGMMDCKKALEEAEGDFDKAAELLRIKLGKKAAARGAEREATSGLVATSGGALVELKSETDFVAKNDEFVATAQKIADAAAEAKAADTETLKGVPLDGKTVGEVVEKLAITIGEKIELGQVAYFDGQSVVYMHKRAADLPPAVGVLVEYDGSDEDAARGAAMQIAAMKPQYLSRDDVPADVVEKEREIGAAIAREEGKPEQAIEKIAEGRLNGFFKDVALLDQPSVTDSKKNVKAVLDAAGVDGEAVRPLRGRRLTRTHYAEGPVRRSRAGPSACPGQRRALADHEVDHPALDRPRGGGRGIPDHPQQRLPQRPAPGPGPGGLVQVRRLPEDPACRRVQEGPGDHEVAGGIAHAGGPEVDHARQPAVPDQQVADGDVAVEPRAGRSQVEASASSHTAGARPSGPPRPAPEAPPRLLVVRREVGAAVERVRAGDRTARRVERPQRAQEPGQVGGEPAGVLMRAVRGRPRPGSSGSPTMARVTLGRPARADWLRARAAADGAPARVASGAP